MTLDEVLAEVRKNNGGTYVSPFGTSNYWAPADLSDSSDGYYIGTTGGIDNLPRLRKILVRDFIEFNQPYRVGFWFDEKSKRWSLDVTHFCGNLTAAMAMANICKQKAIWDIKNNREIGVI